MVTYAIAASANGALRHAAASWLACMANASWPNTYARELNPAGAPGQIQGVFHPNYAELHGQAARHLGQLRAVIFKGSGGEARINPRKPIALAVLQDGELRGETWPALLQSDDPEWRGARHAPGPEAAIIDTAALALHVTGKAATPDATLAQARALWQERKKEMWGK